MADNNKEAAGQLDIQTQINKVLQQRTGILKNQAKFLSAQTQTAMEMCKALDCEGLDGMKDRLAEIQDGLSEAAEEAKNLEGRAASAGASINKMATKGAKQGGLMSKVFSPMGGMFAGLGVGMMSAFKGATNMVGGFLSSGKRVIGIIGSIGKSLITLPFSLLNNLTSFAAGAGGGVSALRQAMEDLKETFGSLASNEGKAVMQGFKNIRKQSQSLGGSGVRMARIFGHGQEGLANAMKSVGEQMTDLGPMMTKFSSEIENNAGVFEVYRRGLGLTGDNFKALGTMAATNGQSLEATLDQVGSQAINMGKQFGISSKLIAGDMAAMAGDVANFGTMGPKVLSSLAVYTRKLGIEAKELTGVISAWDNFEDAAQGASKLSQAFGMNIDAMQMMNEQDPGKRMDMLRESFQATGKSVEDLSRQELKLLSAQMGLSEEAAKKALSSDMDYDDIVAGSEDAEAKTISQAEAMKELADAMKQTFGGGGQGPKTFMEALVKGFERGIMRGKGMRKMFQNIRGSLRETYRFGRDLGKMFVDMFPGIQDMVKGLTDLFSPRRFARLRRDLLGAFRNLFRDLRTDPKAGVETFTKRIKEIFANFFNGSGGAGKQFMKGLKTFGKTVALLILSLLPVMMRGLASLIHKLADFIRDPSAFTDAASGLGDGIQQALSSAWENVVDTWPVLVEAFGALWDAVKPALGKMWEVIWPYLLGAIVFKSIVAVAANMALGGIWAVLFNAFKMLFSTSMSKGADAGGKEGAKTMKRGGGFINSLKKVIRDLAKLKGSDVNKAIKNVAKLILFVGVSLVGLAIALWAAVSIVSNVDPAKLAIMSAVLIGLMISMGPMSAAAIALKGISWKDVMKSMAKVGIVVLAMSALTLIMGGVLVAFGQMGITMEGVKNFFIVMGAILVAGLVAILLAIPVGMIADKFGMQIAIGLGVLGIVMIALGAIGLIVGGMLSVFSNPEGIAAMMNAISTMLLTTAAMLPIAGMLGVMLMAFPFGTAGVAILVAGFGVLGTLTSALVGAVMPAIREIAGMQIENPEKVKTVVDMIVSVIDAIANFTGQFARVLEALKPPPDSAADQMEKNITAAKDLLTALLENGINEVIRMIMDVAKSSDVTGLGVQAAQAIGAVLTAVGQIMGSIQPNQSMMASVMDVIDDDDVDEFMRATADFARVQGANVMKTIKTIKDTFLSQEFITLANSISGPGLEFIKAMVPLFSTIGEISKALQPDPAIFQAIKGSIDDDDYDDFMREMTRFARTQGVQMRKMIKSFGPVMKDVITAVGTMINSINPGSEETLKAVAPMLGPIFEALGQMMSGVFPIINQVIKGATNRRGKINVGKLNRIANSMKTVFGSVGELLSTMGPSLGTLVDSVIQAASGVGDAKTMGPKIDIVSSAIEAVGNLMQMFDPSTSNIFSSFVSSADQVQYYVNGQRVSMLGAAIHNMESFTDRVLGPGGPLQNLITKLGNISITDAQSRNVKRVTPALDALGKIFDFVKVFRELDTTGTGDLAGIADSMDTTFRELVGVNWDGEDGLKGLMEAIGSGDWGYSTRTINARANGMKKLKEFLETYQDTHPAIIAASRFDIQHHKNARAEFTWIAGDMRALETSITPELEATVARTLGTIQNIVGNYNAISSLLEATSPIDVNARISEFGANMSISQDSVTIENKPINITVNFNVTMDADRMALSLSNENGRSNSVQLSRRGGQPVGG